MEAGDGQRMAYFVGGDEKVEEVEEVQAVQAGGQDCRLAQVAGA